MTSHRTTHDLAPSMNLFFATIQVSGAFSTRYSR
jgi:hypothetical protein